MNRSEACQLIGADAHAALDEIHRVYKARRRDLDTKMARAADNPRVQEELTRQLAELDRAMHMILELSPVPSASSTVPTVMDTPLTVTQQGDVPIAEIEFDNDSSLDAEIVHDSDYRNADGDRDPSTGSRPRTPGSSSGTPGRRPALEGGKIRLKIGDTLAGRYVIRGEIGKGGMGIVYRALDTTKDEEIAIKVMRPEYVSFEQARARFKNEGLISTRLSHPNITNVFDVHEADGICFLTMELLTGRTLRSDMEDRKRLRKPYEPREVLEYARMLCDALSYAHGQTVHRDVKPENIWICDDGIVKLMDFGIAQLLTPSRMTLTGMAPGSIHYMSPEQRENAKSADHRSDEYSLAIVLYEMLVGARPGGAKTKSIADLRVDVPEAMSVAIDKALETNPDDRYPNMMDFFWALSRKGRTRAGRRKVIWLSAVLALAGIIGFAASLDGVQAFFRPMFMAPGAPRIVGVTPGRVGVENTMTVVWNDPSPELTKEFELFRVDSTSKPPIVNGEGKTQPTAHVSVAPENRDGTGAYRFVDQSKDILPNRDYVYYIASVGKAGATLSGKSSLTKALPDLPVPPKIGEARAGEETGKTNSAKITLQMPDVESWEGPEGIRLERRRIPPSAGPNEEFEALKVPVEGNTVIDKGLESDTDYEYRVVVQNRAGKTESKNPIAMRTAAETPSVSYKSKVPPITLGWEPKMVKPGRSLHIVRVEDNKEDTVGSRAAEEGKWVDPNPTEPGKAYSYKVALIGGDKISSDYKTLEPVQLLPDPPAVPKQLAIASVSPQQFLLKLPGPHKDAVEYIIERAQKSVGENVFKEVARVSINQADYLDTDILGGNEYRYRLKARNNGGESPESVATDWRLAALPPPKNLRVQFDVQQLDKKNPVVVLNWGPPTDTTARVVRYIVVRNGQGQTDRITVDETRRDFFQFESRVPGPGLYNYQLGAICEHHGENLIPLGAKDIQVAVVTPTPAAGSAAAAAAGAVSTKPKLTVVPIGGVAAAAGGAAAGGAVPVVTPVGYTQPPPRQRLDMSDDSNNFNTMFGKSGGGKKNK